MLTESLLHEKDSALSLLREVVDHVAYSILSSTMDTAKTATQICNENNIPLSSTYKKIKKLQKMGLVLVERIIIDDNGKRVVFYRSRIKSLEFILKKEGVRLQLNNNEIIATPTFRF